MQDRLVCQFPLPEDVLSYLTETSNIWWKNLVPLKTVHVHYKGKLVQAKVSIEINNKEAIESMLKTLCTENRIDGFFANVGYKNGEPIQDDLALSAKRMTLIRIEIL